jgi:hypothetical protein
MEIKCVCPINVGDRRKRELRMSSVIRELSKPNRPTSGELGNFAQEFSYCLALATAFYIVASNHAYASDENERMASGRVPAPPMIIALTMWAFRLHTPVAVGPSLEDSRKGALRKISGLTKLGSSPADLISTRLDRVSPSMRLALQVN